MHCIAFPMPVGIRFKHPFAYEIGIPLPVLNWYGLIKYASAYVGSNMHPIIVSLHNGTPCYSIDYWGRQISGEIIWMMVQVKSLIY